MKAIRMKPLSRPSRWLLLYLAERHPIGIVTTLPLPVSDYRDQPKMRNMHGLVKRGWAREEGNGIYFITEEGRKAAKAYEHTN